MLSQFEVYKKALFYYEKSLELDPNNKELLGNIAIFYEQNGDSTKAKSYPNRLLNRLN